MMDRERNALLIMDVQPEIVARLDDDGLLQRVAAAARAARSAGIRVIYVKVGFREGYPEIGRSSPTFSRVASLGGFIEGQSSTVHPAVAPEAGDIVLSTLRQAADLDFTLTVLSDGCSDRDVEVHRVLCEKVFHGRRR